MKVLVSLIGFLFILLLVPASGTIINVPGDYTTIQNAINASSDNDTVLVADGTYTENIDFSGKAILVTSVNGPEFTNIEIQTSSSPVVTINSGEGPGSILSGFTIDGDSSYWGIHLDNTSPVIYNNIIKNHEVGIRVDTGGSPLIRKNEITLCSHIDISPHNGGGIRMEDIDGAVIDSNRIHHNYSNVAGGIFLYHCDNITVDRNLIYSNSSYYIGGLEIANCNTVNVYNNTFVDNSSNGMNLGSINCSSSFNLSVINNIVAFNNEYGICYYQFNTNMVTAYNDVYDNDPANYYFWNPGTGSINADPYFLDMANDVFELNINSPCINAGDPAFPLDPNGSIIEMGAIYFDYDITGYGSLAGVVTDTSGSPIENVQVSIINTGYEDLTDINGGYFISNLPSWTHYDVLFSHPNCVDSTITDVSVFADDTTYVDVVLKYSGSIAGTVTDDSQNPIEGVAIEVIETGDSTFTDINGDYIISGLTAGNYSLFYSHRYYYDTTLTNLNVNPNDTTIIDIVLYPGDFDVEIWFGNPHGNPITAQIGERVEIDAYIQMAPGIHVTGILANLGLEDQYFDSLLSNNEGSVYDTLQYWPYSWFLDPSGSPPNPIGWSCETYMGVGLDTTVPPSYLPLICPEPTKILTYVVKTVNNPSLNGNTISCLRSGINESQGYPLYGDSLGTILSYAEYFSPIHFVLGPPIVGSLAGTVTDNIQNPLEGVTVTISGTGQSDITDANGDYYISDIDAGTHDVDFSHPIYCDTTVSGVTIIQDVTTTLNMSMAGTGFIAGHVTDTVQNAIAGVIVEVVDSDITDTTDSNGEYLLEYICPGIHMVLFSHPGYNPHNEANVIVNAGDTTTVDVVLGPEPANDVMVWYGTLDGSPLSAEIGSRLNINVFLQTASDIFIDYINIPLGLENQYFDSLLSENEGLIFDVLPQWDLVFFNEPTGSPPNPGGWSAESVTGFAEIVEPYNSPVLSCHTQTRIASFIVKTVNDSTLIGDTVQCFGSGFNPSGTGLEFGSDGLPITDLVEYFSPVLFTGAAIPGAVAGIVTDTSQNPIAGVLVNLSGTGVSDTTEIDGSYIIGAPPGTYDLSFFHQNYIPAIISGVEIVSAETTTVNITLYEVGDECNYIIGDVNNSGSYNGLDVTFGVNFFKGGPAPIYSCECTPGNIWYVAGDVNNSCSYNGLDITYGVSYFKGGPDPMPCADCPPISVSIIRKTNIEWSK